MKCTISALKNAKEITVEEYYGVRTTIHEDGTTTSTAGRLESVYKFKYDKKTKKLFVYGDVFGKEMYEVKNSSKVLFDFAKGYAKEIEVEDYKFEIYNAKISF